MYDFGDTVALKADCRNSSGALADATAVSLTITLPDGTASSHAPANPPPTTGQYTHDFVTTQAGRHVFRYVFTGAVPTQAFTDVFHVWPQAPTWIIGLAEAKDALNIDQAVTTYDDELRRTIAGASAVVEDIVGIVAVRSFTETYSGGDAAILLRHRPVVAVDSVTEDGIAVDTADYSVGESGVLVRSTSYVAGIWAAGVDNIAVTYRTGRTVVADNILDGTRDLVRVNFRPQSGGNFRAFDTGGQREPGQIRLGFYVPNSVMQRLAASALGPHVG